MNRQPLLAISLALGVGVAGYALTGSPAIPSAPAPERVVNPRLTPEAEQASRELLENFGDVRAWLTLSDALIRAGRTETAVAALQSALEAIPGNADLWVQMGIALVAHANGEVVPAARLAFDRASRLSPDHPAPSYFLGLAWLQAGEVDEALATWQALRERSTEDAPWLSMLDEKIAAGEKMKAMMEMGTTPAG
ncbi:tetratricopeptide repeat protein [Sandaracinobacter sp. RS1-74]|uniref:tetratricopeptide repeat protein n=1 Tax=Sandaracinobacteroides sayramensis TaxID=2913411 RepID=UPI001EDB20C2|nr:tetratricopeptide repeat protein [Sandaracinobacteroides sayramensis]MCG2841355.1 tetratricopeptide repeat protein [Sandaracinobacteroides sayramensis]